MARKIAILLVALALIALAVGIASPLTKITNKATVTYTDAAGNEKSLDSNEATVTRLDPPRLAGVPASVFAGDISTLTLACDVGGPEWSYKVTCPCFGGTYQPGSLVIDGDAGEVVSGPSGDIVVSLEPRTEPGEVKLSWKVKW